MRLLGGKRRSAPPALGQADELVAQGRALEALDQLLAANRDARNDEVEARLVTLRNQAFAELGDPGSGFVDPAPVSVGSDPADDGLPSVRVEELTAPIIRGAFLSHGCLIVRGLIEPGRAAELIAGIDRVFDGRDAFLDGASAEETAPWYQPFEPDPLYAQSVSIGRGFVGRGSGVWTADSPRLMFDLLETFEAAGMRRIVSEYLGERPALSVNKGTLRRAAPKVGTEWWHQDGAFLGAGIRSLNIWLSLNASGVDAPGLEVVPMRLEEIVDKGTEGADFDWSVGEPVVERVSGGKLASPVFEPGDAMLFDHLFLHRTGTTPEMTKTRYATETWFFAPSAYPDPQDQVPLAY
jgi:hypothetical protein